MLLCAATAVAVAGAFGTVVVCALPFELADGGFTRMSVFVTLFVSAGVFTLVDFYFHFAGLQPAFEEAQQQAAAAGGHYASEAQATPRVDVGDPPEASSFHLCVRLSCLPLQLQILKGVCCLCHSAWAGIVLACGGEQGSFQRRLDATFDSRRVEGAAQGVCAFR